MLNLLIQLIQLGNNPFFWIVLYLVGYALAIVALAFFGMQKLTGKIPHVVLRAFIALVFVLPPIALLFTRGPKIRMPLVFSFFAGSMLLGVGIASALLADYFVTPVLIKWTKPFGKEK